MKEKTDHIDDDDIEHTDCQDELVDDECQLDAEYLDTQKRTEQLVKKILKRQT